MLSGGDTLAKNGWMVSGNKLDIVDGKINHSYDPCGQYGQ